MHFSSIFTILDIPQGEALFCITTYLDASFIQDSSERSKDAGLSVSAFQATQLNFLLTEPTLLSNIVLTPVTVRHFTKSTFQGVTYIFPGSNLTTIVLTCGIVTK